MRIRAWAEVPCRDLDQLWTEALRDALDRNVQGKHHGRSCLPKRLTAFRPSRSRGRGCCAAGIDLTNASQAITSLPACEVPFPALTGFHGPAMLPAFRTPFRRRGPRMAFRRRYRIEKPRRPQIMDLGVPRSSRGVGTTDQSTTCRTILVCGSLAESAAFRRPFRRQPNGKGISAAGTRRRGAPRSRSGANQPPGLRCRAPMVPPPPRAGSPRQRWPGRSEGGSSTRGRRGSVRGAGRSDRHQKVNLVPKVPTVMFLRPGSLPPSSS
jgi:hypothetical protein